MFFKCVHIYKLRGGKLYPVSQILPVAYSYKYLLKNSHALLLILSMHTLAPQQQS